MDELQFAAKVDRDPTMVWCPTPDCNTAVQLSAKDASGTTDNDGTTSGASTLSVITAGVSPHAACPTCHLEFCADCRSPTWHKGSTCDSHARHDKDKDKRRFLRWAHKRTRTCPSCKVTRIMATHSVLQVEYDFKTCVRSRLKRLSTAHATIWCVRGASVSFVGCAGATFPPLVTLIATTFEAVLVYSLVEIGELRTPLQWQRSCTSADAFLLLILLYVVLHPCGGLARKVALSVGIRAKGCCTWR